MRQFLETENDALAVASKIIQASPSDLMAAIQFESRWYPQAKNPNSSARGLIQFMDKTAVELGYRDSAHLVKLHPTTESQLLGPVVRYFLRWKTHPSLQAICMAIFYPEYRFKPEDTAFPDWVQKANPGITTPADYLRKVRASCD